MRKVLIFFITIITVIVLPSELAVGEGNLAFNVSGDVTADATYNLENTDSVYNNVFSLDSAATYAALNGKLMFSRQYTTLGLLDFTFSDTNILSHLDGTRIESFLFKVNELYTDVNFFDTFFLRLGKQRLKWGAGYVFNPSDPINPPKNPTDVTLAQEGVSAIKAEFIFPIISLMSFGVFYDNIEDTGVGSKLSTSLIPNTDLSVSFYYSNISSWLTAVNTSIAPFYDFPGWDTLQFWFEGCIYDEARYASYQEGSLPGSAEMMEVEDIKYNFLIGTEFQIPVVSTKIIAEYYHLSEGLSLTDEEAIFTALNSQDPGIQGASLSWYQELSERPGQIGKDYLFLSLVQPTFTDNGNPFWDYVGFSANCLMNITDLSFILSTTVTTTFITDSTIDFNLNWAYGDKETEFGNTPANLSMGIVAKVYF